MTFKQMKTAKLGIVLQLTEVSADAKKERLWEVHDVERNRGFRVTVPAASGGKTLSADALETAIGLAVERFLVSSPELVAGPMYEVQVGSQDFDELARLKS